MATDKKTEQLSALQKLLAITEPTQADAPEDEFVFNSWKVTTYQGTNKKTGKPYFGCNVFPISLAHARQKPALSAVQAIVQATLLDSDGCAAAIEKAQQIMADHASESEDDEPETAEERKARLSAKIDNAIKARK
jgi:hypothetical protein